MEKKNEISQHSIENCSTQSSFFSVNGDGLHKENQSAMMNGKHFWLFGQSKELLN
jgi:hypothetical protein